MTESYPGQEQQRARLPLDTLLHHLQQLSATTADVELNALPGLYESEGQQSQATPPEPMLPDTNGYLLKQLGFGDLRPGDTIRGSYILDAADAVVADTDDTHVWAKMVDLDPSGNVLPLVHLRYTRRFVETHRDAFRKLTGHIIVLDALVDNASSSYEGGFNTIDITSPQVVALERPVRLAQLEGLPEGSEVLLDGIVRKVYRNSLDNGLGIESPTDGMIKVGTVPIVNYERTVDGDAIPDTPQSGDHIFIRATQRMGIGRTPERRLFAMKLYRNQRTFDNEARELDVKAELEKITSQLDDVHNDEAFPVFCDLLGRIVSLAPHSKAFFRAKTVYDYYFADTAADEMPIGIAYEGFLESLQKYDQLFGINVTGMNAQQFRAFTLDVSRGRLATTQEIEDEQQLVRALFALPDHNPALIRTAIKEVLPTLAAGTSLQPLQVRIIEQAFSQAVEHLDPMLAAHLLAEAATLSHEVRTTDNHEVLRLFEELGPSLLRAARQGYRQCTDPEATFLQKQAITTFATLLYLLERP